MKRAKRHTVDPQKRRRDSTKSKGRKPKESKCGKRAKRGKKEPTRSPQKKKGLAKEEKHSRPGKKRRTIHQEGLVPNRQRVTKKKKLQVQE